METDFYFAITLRSKRASRDWRRVERLFGDTLQSILAQTDKRFSVLVACHDLPDVPGMDDERVTVMISDREAPGLDQPRPQLNDKAYKKFMMAAEVKRRGGGYYMLFDADDLVSKNLIEHVRATDNRRGYVLDKGYRLDATTGEIRLTNNFHGVCGSSNIVYFEPHELPDEPGPVFEMEWNTEIHRLLGAHATVAASAEALGRPLDRIPFPAAVYIENHGDNHTRTGKAEASVLSRCKQWWRSIKRARANAGVRRALASEFGLSASR